MSPTAEAMRTFVKQMYSGDRWRRRVRRMSDEQVAAIYLKQQAKAVQAEIARKKSDPDIPF